MYLGMHIFVIRKKNTLNISDLWAKNNGSRMSFTLYGFKSKFDAYSDIVL